MYMYIYRVNPTLHATAIASTINPSIYFYLS